MPRKTPTILTDTPAGSKGFNEAAARCRGKLGRFASVPHAGAARFNEAAARCRGKRPADRAEDAVGGPGLQ